MGDDWRCAEGSSENPRRLFCRKSQIGSQSQFDDECGMEVSQVFLLMHGRVEMMLARSAGVVDVSNFRRLIDQPMDAVTQREARHSPRATRAQLRFDFQVKDLVPEETETLLVAGSAVPKDEGGDAVAGRQRVQKTAWGYTGASGPGGTARKKQPWKLRPKGAMMEWASSQQGEQAAGNLHGRWQPVFTAFLVKGQGRCPAQGCKEDQVGWRWGPGPGLVGSLEASEGGMTKVEIPAAPLRLHCTHCGQVGHSAPMTAQQAIQQLPRVEGNSVAISGHGGLRLCSDEAVVASGPTVAQRHEDFSQLRVLQGCGGDDPFGTIKSAALPEVPLKPELLAQRKVLESTGSVFLILRRSLQAGAEDRHVFVAELLFLSAAWVPSLGHHLHMQMGSLDSLESIPRLSISTAGLMSEGGEQGQVESSLEIWSLRGLVIETDEVASKLAHHWLRLLMRQSQAGAQTCRDLTRTSVVWKGGYLKLEYNLI
ncbi:hypothetical protein AK812_SmicGene11381 [Symbiodinium microadriaticum]|uniref:Uncharacterized protein n=1 Tax=Symbiodinium microadriaticum TaxID=2951 RepID=A0A1Q9EDD6_SYMMI|nr:hypothetical protein AK812_SmicGene11381 [Symbiodinium microadriaticum]